MRDVITQHTHAASLFPGERNFRSVQATPEADGSFLIQIKRVSSWADETFIDQQHVETVSMFYVAVGIYAVLFVINSFNVINACITLRYDAARTL